MKDIGNTCNRERKIRRKGGIKKKVQVIVMSVQEKFVETKGTKMLSILISMYQKEPENRVSHVIIGKNM